MLKMIVECGTKEDISSWMKLVSSVSCNFPGLETEEGYEQYDVKGGIMQYAWLAEAQL